MADLLLLTAAVTSESVDDSLWILDLNTGLPDTDVRGFFVADWAGFFDCDLELAGVDADNDGLTFFSGVTLIESESESSSLSDDV